jgi:cytochrome c556
MLGIVHLLPLHSPRTAVMAGAILLASVGMSTLAPGQDRSAAVVKDAIFARKILMVAIGHNMDEIEGMMASPKGLDMAEAGEHADNISIMLMAFPHLFPADTNQWKPKVERDPGRDTYAAPELWTNYEDFYARAAQASKVAYNASRARQESAFKTFAIALRVACDSCHAAYLKSDQ